MTDLPRDGVTAAIVAVFERAIAAGELAPGEKLPPTRELAQLASVNHLTAARAYRQLAERGLVVSKVGSGTFVRTTPAVLGKGERVRDSIAWQRYALPDREEGYGDRVLAEMMDHVHIDGLLALSAGYPSERIFPVELIRDLTAEVIRDNTARALQYSDVRGIGELAQRVADLSATRGAPEDPDDIVITSGATQGVSLAMRAILEPGDVVACEDPSFMCVIRAIRAAGAQVMPVPVDRDGLDIDALEALLTRMEIKAIALQPRLHNPTGTDLSAERRARLLDLARLHGLFIVEDGVYGELRMEGEPVPSLRAEAPANVIYADSLSKTIGGGFRAGWVAASGPVLERIVAEKRSDDIHSPVLTQLVTASYLASGAHASQVERALAHYRRGRDAALEAIDKHLGQIASYDVPRGGGHVWVRLDSGASEQDLVDEARRQGVAFVPGSAMRSERSPDLSLRLSFGYLDPPELEEGVRRIGAALRAVSARRPPRAATPV
ncbi:MAG: PLP-dependent aminotransferase family protein [Actinomycetota bacterium]|nr:PLP-dependent aminotransferase family protein [Actinomycetota bacterium]